MHPNRAGAGDGKWQPLSINRTLFKDLMESFKYPEWFVHSLRLNNGAYARFINNERDASGKITPKSLGTYSKSSIFFIDPRGSFRALLTPKAMTTESYLSFLSKQNWLLAF